MVPKEGSRVVSRASFETTRRTYITGVMADGEVGSCLAGLWWFGLQEVGRFAQVVVVQFFLEGLVGSLGEHRFFFQDGQDTHRLLNEEMLARGRRRRGDDEFVRNFAWFGVNDGNELCRYFERLTFSFGQMVLVKRS